MAKPKKRINQKLAKPQKSSNAKWFILGGVAIVLVIIAVVIFVSRAGTGAYTYDSVNKKPSGRPYSADSPINQTIPTDVQKSLIPSAYSAIFNSTANPATNISLLQWSYPIYDAVASTPTAKIWCSPDLFAYGVDGFCPNITNSTLPVYMPDNPVPQAGEDKHLVVIDNVNKLAYDYAEWGRNVGNPVGAKYTSGYGGRASITGNGVGPSANGPFSGQNIARLAPGAGIIRTYEVQEGSIEHALVLTTSKTCNNTIFVYPAKNSDGTAGTDQNTCIPVGTRVQLDPSINFDSTTYANMSKLEKMIAKSLQKYGAYVFDTGGTPSAGFAVEKDRSATGDVYQKATAGSNNVIAAGQDYYSLKSIPWANMYKIKPQWNADGTKAYAWGGTTTTTTTTMNTVTTTTTTTPTPTTTTTTTTSAPTPPTNLTATNIFDTQVYFQWGAGSNGVTGYRIYKDGAPYTTVPATTLNYNAQYLAPSKTYVFEVTSYNSSNQESAKSNKLTVTTKAGCFLFACW
jgi:hypothetical protein